MNIDAIIGIPMDVIVYALILFKFLAYHSLGNNEALGAIPWPLFCWCSNFNPCDHPDIMSRFLVRGIV